MHPAGIKFGVTLVTFRERVFTVTLMPFVGDRLCTPFVSPLIGTLHFVRWQAPLCFSHLRGAQFSCLKDGNRSGISSRSQWRPPSHTSRRLIPCWPTIPTLGKQQK